MSAALAHTCPADWSPSHGRSSHHPLPQSLESLSRSIAFTNKSSKESLLALQAKQEAERKKREEARRQREEADLDRLREQEKARASLEAEVRSAGRLWGAV